MTSLTTQGQILASLTIITEIRKQKNEVCMTKPVNSEKKEGIKFYLWVSSTTSIENFHRYMKVFEVLSEYTVWGKGRMVDVPTEDDVDGVEKAIFIPIDRNLDQSKTCFEELERIAAEFTRLKHTQLARHCTALTGFFYPPT
jgi:hypothetical protein